MLINANEIEILIRAAKAMVERLPEDEQYVHASDIAATLQKLIDDEAKRLAQVQYSGEVEIWRDRR
mgnify:CR=1 FL=1